MAADKDDKPKDFWDKAQIFFVPLNGLLTAVAVGLLGYFTSNTLRQRETRETNERVYTELMSGREQAESSLRKDMFLSIIQTFLQPEAASADSKAIEAKLLNLEMLAYNFHESLNLKPLFSHLDRQLMVSKDPAKKAYFDRLHRVAGEIATRQSVLLEQVGQRFSRPIDFDIFRDTPGGLDLEPGKLTLEGIEREFMIAVTGVDTDRQELTVELRVRTPKESSEVRALTFHVGYYDFPMIDNTRLSHDQRAAVVLKQFGEDSAELALVVFPGSYASLKERVSYDEVVEKLRQQTPP
jgi:hypothetical protein